MIVLQGNTVPEEESNILKLPPKLDVKKLADFDFEGAIIASAIENADEFILANDLIFPTHENVGEYMFEPSGAQFIVPLAIPEELMSGDARSFKKGALSSRFLPLPLMWQVKTASGHDGAVVVGRIDYLERTESGLGNAHGVFDVGPFGREAERMVRGGFLRGVSADLDQFKANTETPDDAELADKKNTIENDKIIVQEARLMGITIVAKPAFQECFILIKEEPVLEIEEEIMPDGVYEEVPEDFDSELAALAASAAPVVPPKSWFRNPALSGPTPLTTTDDGRVFGHIAAWQTSHIGMPGRGVKPPRSATQYAYFRTGELRTDEGDVQVGQLTLSGGHASIQASAKDAIKHYDETNSAVADVSAGEDQFGIWVAGALRPEVTPQQVRQFRASSPSGDWRPINGRLELVAVVNVNVPGFPVARAIVAGGAPMALVAAGAAVLAEIKENARFTELETRISEIEQTSINAKFSTANDRMSSIVEARKLELSTRMAASQERINARKVVEAAALSVKMEELRARFNS